MEHTKVVELLIENGASINSKDKEGYSALMRASLWGRTKVVELLLKYKPNIEAKNIAGLTALALAAEEGKTEVVELLLNANCDPKGGADQLTLSLLKFKYLELDRRQSPYHLAHDNGHKELASTIKAAINDRNKKVVTPEIVGFSLFSVDFIRKYQR